MTPCSVADRTVRVPIGIQLVSPQRQNPLVHAYTYVHPGARNADNTLCVSRIER